MPDKCVFSQDSCCTTLSRAKSHPHFRFKCFYLQSLLNSLPRRSSISDWRSHTHTNIPTAHLSVPARTFCYLLTIHLSAGVILFIAGIILLVAGIIPLIAVVIRLSAGFILLFAGFILLAAGSTLLAAGYTYFTTTSYLLYAGFFHYQFSCLPVLPPFFSRLPHHG